MAPCTFIYFDAGFTVLRPHPSVGFHYAAVAEKYGVQADPDALNKAFFRAWKGARAAVRGDEPMGGRTLEEAEQFWTGVVRGCFTEAGLTTPKDSRFFRHLFDLFAEPSCWRLYDDVLPAMELLDRKGIPFGILSNWDSRLRSVLAGFDILPRLSAVVLSCEAGYEKPHPKIYEAAAAAVEPSRRGTIGLIGDEADADGTAALAAGWRQCLIARDGKVAESPLKSAADLVGAVEILLGE